MNATKIIPLYYWTCYFLDSENGFYPTVKANLVFKCFAQGKFLVGHGPTGHNYYGHMVCDIITVLIFIIGTFGFVTNILNVIVLRRSLKGSSSLKTLLIILAVFELIACVFAMFFSTMVELILENITRTEATFYLLKSAHVLYTFGRTAAIYITILVAIERYLVVAFPIQSKSWLSPRKSQIYLSVVILLSILLTLPWILNTTIDKNNTALVPNTTLANFPYILKATGFAINVYPKMRLFQLVMNYVAPFPLLLFFNGLLYHSIYKWSKNRQSMSRNQKKEIGAAKMFSVVVLILLLCHSVSCVIVFASQYLQAVYRELMLLQMLSVTLSAAINFLVYFGFGKAFRDEFKKLLGNCPGRNAQETSQTTQTSRDKESSFSEENKGVKMEELNKA
ncbi:FMRFamide receptor [Orchesella cincta]|uniref:FMRFamide receptor n=1 Tax=Orchesella cincta TaxID=48709 RepID=A0A1D2M7P4_ORCCI|nr:FMRFamide receptor [Orchesella cincta]